MIFNDLFTPTTTTIISTAIAILFHKTLTHSPAAPPVMSMPPPPPYLYVTGSYINTNTHHSHSFDKFKPSFIVILLILAITLLSSISLCFLLRHLNRRCLRHLSTVTTVSTNADSRRVSPENPSLSILDSLPLFTFSSVTRPSSSGGDCAVCLSKFEPQDQLRLLPLCCHAFHALCIDIWLKSNQTCPLCRSPIHSSESDVLKGIQASSAAVGDTDSFRLEIGSISRRQAVPESGELQPRSYSLGSFDYIVEGDYDITMDRTYQRSISDKEDTAFVADSVSPTSEANLASEVAVGRSWLKDYVDRLSFSLSSRTLSFRSSGRFYTGSSRRTDVAGVGDSDLEANRAGEEISELFRWLSGV
ncbi:E3 ubiquitin-protein ligase ATL4-like [Mangifera indica]|uniref:E3 ubiquitin-protein ligase ATL4-like n=1 Tax=Mangifera indica TaxID=29780 RepID=UPI001CF9BFD8|nr:E3 ubiquitin-protein ligase ATL4-like [Mangifera indica]